MSLKVEIKQLTNKPKYPTQPKASKPGKAADLGNKVTTATKKTVNVLPAEDEDFQNKAQEIQALKQTILQNYENGVPSPQKELDSVLTKDQEEKLLLAFNAKYDREGVKVVRGGVHYVFFLDSMPDVVFKKEPNEKDAKKEVALSEKANQVVVENNLFLLHVPKSKEIQVGGHFFVMQERADLISGSYAEQKGLYSNFWDDETMEDYMKELFSQLLVFDSKTDFADFKYDNIPLTKKGIAALIDQDGDSFITGLTKGKAATKDGLFNYIPLKYLEGYIQKAKSVLSPENYEKFEEALVKEGIRERAKRKEARKESYSQFAKENHISISSQQLKTPLPTLFPDEKMQQVAGFIVDNLNEELSKSNNLSPKVGRKVVLKFNVAHTLGKKVFEIFEDTIKTLYRDGPTVDGIIQDVLAGLQKAGYIEKFKVFPKFFNARVSC